MPVKDPGARYHNLHQPQRNTCHLYGLARYLQSKFSYLAIGLDFGASNVNFQIILLHRIHTDQGQVCAVNWIHPVLPGTDQVYPAFPFAFFTPEYTNFYQNLLIL